eukprot:181788-Hanusia_phi.AAC.4
MPCSGCLHKHLSREDPGCRPPVEGSLAACTAAAGCPLLRWRVSAARQRAALRQCPPTTAAAQRFGVCESGTRGSGAGQRSQSMHSMARCWAAHTDSSWESPCPHRKHLAAAGKWRFHADVDLAGWLPVHAHAYGVAQRCIPRARLRALRPAAARDQHSRLIGELCRVTRLVNVEAATKPGVHREDALIHRLVAHCFRLQRLLAAQRAKQPVDVGITRRPARLCPVTDCCGCAIGAEGRLRLDTQADKVSTRERLRAHHRRLRNVVDVIIKGQHRPRVSRGSTHEGPTGSAWRCPELAVVHKTESILLRIAGKSLARCAEADAIPVRGAKPKHVLPDVPVAVRVPTDELEQVHPLAVRLAVPQVVPHHHQHAVVGSPPRAKVPGHALTVGTIHLCMVLQHQSHGVHRRARLGNAAEAVATGLLHPGAGPAVRQVAAPALAVGSVDLGIPHRLLVEHAEVGLPLIVLQQQRLDITHPVREPPCPPLQVALVHALHAVAVHPRRVPGLRGLLVQRAVELVGVGVPGPEGHRPVESIDVNPQHGPHRHHLDGGTQQALILQARRVGPQADAPCRVTGVKTQPSHHRDGQPWIMAVVDIPHEEYLPQSCKGSSSRKTEARMVSKSLDRKVRPDIHCLVQQHALHPPPHRQLDLRRVVEGIEAHVGQQISVGTGLGLEGVPLSRTHQRCLLVSILRHQAVHAKGAGCAALVLLPGAEPSLEEPEQRRIELLIDVRQRLVVVVRAVVVAEHLDARLRGIGRIQLTGCRERLEVTTKHPHDGAHQRVHPARRAVVDLVSTRIERREIACRAAIESILQRPQAVRLAPQDLEALHKEVLLRAELQRGAHLQRTADVAKRVLPRPALEGVQEPSAGPLHMVLHAEIKAPRPSLRPPSARGGPRGSSDGCTHAVEHTPRVRGARREKVSIVAIAGVWVHVQDATVEEALLDLRVSDARVAAVPQNSRVDAS